VPTNARPSHELQNGSTTPSSGMGPFFGPNQPSMAQHEMRTNMPTFPYPSPQLLRPPSNLDNRRDYTPLGHFLDDNSQPWTPHRIGHPGLSGVEMNFPRPSFVFENPPGSEVGTTLVRSDSGYTSQPAHPVLDVDPDTRNRDIREVTCRTTSLTVNSTPTEFYPPRSADAISQISHNTQTSHGKEFRCSECTEISKCRSDYKSVPWSNW
jgi:hypothetical protein